MPILADIIEWVEDKPKFWQHAVKRIIRNKNLSGVDIDELVEICKSEYKISDSEFEDVDIEALKERVGSSELEQSVRLVKISKNENINALKNNSELIFAENGVSGIYGDNGSGKSSYSGVLKNTCNTRGNLPAINHNLFDPDSKDKEQVAKVEYKKDDGTIGTVTWKDREVDSSVLKAVNVFDTSSANHYIEGQDEIAFIPSGLVVLEKLAKACNDVDRIINEEKRNLAAKVFDYSILMDDYGTEVTKFLERIDENTKEEELTSYSNHTEESEEKLKKLSKKIDKLKATDPAKDIKENTQKIKRLNTLKSEYKDIYTAFSGKSLNIVRDRVNEFVVDSDASKAASQKAFSGLPIKDVGGDSWNKLWESARKFYNQVNGDDEFPNTDDDAICPLCLQELDNEAKKRFSNFEEFVKADLQEQLEKSTEKLQKAKEYYENIHFDFSQYAPTIEEIEDISEGFEDFQSSYLETIEAERNKVLTHIGASKQIETISTVGFERTPIDTIDELIDGFEKNNERLSKISIDKELLPLQKEYRNLAAIKNLHKYRNEVSGEIARKKRETLLDKCLSQCNTRSVTLFSNSLAEKYVTNTLKENFKDELKRLGFKNIEVVAGTKGQRGRQYHYLQLDTSYGQGVSLKDILSEGEHRCISLATFLSELSLSEHKSAIVFDDPVSSLDHKWRDKIAKRIIEEANERQVIVFTHDITFLMMLQEHALKLDCDIDVKSLTRKKTETGIPATNPPWDALKVSSRVGVLNTIHQKLKVTELNETEEVYNEQVKSFYGKLRETWERLIEEVLLNQTVQRFGRAIQTQRLKKVVDTTEDDYKIIEDNMSKCSIYFEGHDSAGALIESYPDAEEVKEDIEILKTYLNELRRRR
jgi:energy-coupling factor transporter ATP-binding protein EcfA2